MSDFIKRSLDKVRLVILSIFNAIIAIPYFFLFLISKVKTTGNKALWIALWLLVIILLLYAGRDWLPDPLLNILAAVFVLGAVLALAWCIVRWLKGVWRVVFIAGFVLILLFVTPLFILNLPSPILKTVTPINAPVSSIEWQVSQEPDETKKKVLRESLEKEWDEWHRQYYQTTQGNQIIPYDWLRAMEQAPTLFALKNTAPFLSPDNLTRYRVLTGTKGDRNPDGMPIGLPKDIDKFTSQPWTSISCASCHTNQLSYKGKFYLIDGAPSLQDFAYTETMINTLGMTVLFPGKFDRFARKVLGASYGAAQKDELRKEVVKYLLEQRPAFHATLFGTYPTKEGFARVDALGRGPNGQFSPLTPITILDPLVGSNFRISDAPVSYPPLWYTDDFDWVQSVAAIQQPLGRNMTEAWGVNAKIYSEPYRRFQTTLKPQNLFWIETYLSLTEPPDWPEGVFGNIDLAKAKRGEYLYKDKIWKDDLLTGADELPKEKLFEGSVSEEGFYTVVYPAPDKARVQRGLCARCHEPQWAKLTETSITNWGEQYCPPEKWDEYKKTSAGQKLVGEFQKKRFVRLRMYGLDVIGTDPNDAVNFNARQTSFFQIATGPLADYFHKPQVGIAEALASMTLEAKKIVYGQLDGLKDLPESLPKRAEWDGYRPNQFRAPMGYPARPLRGYWATAPYLHNGSVPNIYQLLSPVSERDKVFYVGNTDYDPKNMGYTVRRSWGVFDWLFNSGYFKFDTSISGNSNKGHEFRNLRAGESSRGVIGPYLTPDDRLAIIEYLKELRDITYSPIKPQVEPNRNQFNSDAEFYTAQKKYQWENEYYDYRHEENLRRWKILEGMKFNSGSTLFELKSAYSTDSPGH
jgi:hypothetical protein